jgi:transcription antitermination protein NusB
MKSTQDPRHQHRINLMQKLFTHSFEPRGIDHVDIEEILPHLPQIDEYIQKAAPEWPLPKIAKIDLALLRLSVWELSIIKKEPPKVIIDEAVEIAKEYGNQNSPQFINGVLGSILKTL